MPRKRTSFLIIAVLSLVMLIGLAETAFAGEVKARTSRHMVGTSGKTAYFAVGIDGGGPLYKYNSVKKTKKKIASGKWQWLNVKGKYLYLCKNNWGGSDGRCTYVYRMKTNGKGKKKLASGSHPVVKGKYIYYLGIKKEMRDGRKVDGKVTGLYRMKLNGKGKKKLVSFSGWDWPHELAMSGNKVLYYMNDGWYKYDPSTKKKSYLDKEVILNIGSWDYEDERVESACVGKLNCFNEGHDIYIEKDYEILKEIHFSGEHQMIIMSGKQIMVVTRGMDATGYLGNYIVYMMRSNGTKLKKVAEGELVSGGWDY